VVQGEGSEFKPQHGKKKAYAFTWAQWLMSVIPATWEAKIRRITVRLTGAKS
jgi:hypothetical protein